MGKERILQNILDGRRKHLSKIQGCLIGGAAGDALGYVVEFMHYRDIRQTFGPQGIMEYELENGKAIISDDTQMTLFTANGLLYGETRMMLQGVGSSPHNAVPEAYRDWLYTQDKSFKPEKFISWLVNIPELNNYRAPGRTCLSALRSGKIGTMETPINHSCGCGDENIILYGAETAAITHGHPWGYISAGMLALLIKKIVFSSEKLAKIVIDSLEETKAVFGGNEYWTGFENLMNMAVDLVGNNDDDGANIIKLGEGWVGHETIAIAVYCALRYEHDFSRAIIAAVNHDGDSDSTGAVCGNILGAYLGLEGIDPRWKKNLELYDTIMEIGTDLCDHCHMEGNGDYEDPDWLRKYVNVAQE